MWPISWQLHFLLTRVVSHSYSINTSPKRTRRFSRTWEIWVDSIWSFEIEQSWVYSNISTSTTSSTSKFSRLSLQLQVETNGGTRERTEVFGNASKDEWNHKTQQNRPRNLFPKTSKLRIPKIANRVVEAYERVVSAFKDGWYRKNVLRYIWADYADRYSYMPKKTTLPWRISFSSTFLQYGLGWKLQNYIKSDHFMDKLSKSIVEILTSERRIFLDWCPN